MSNRHSLPDMSKETLELLWARVRQRGDLPGFSKVAGAILGAMRGEDDCEFNLTKTVLSDPALTQKVLRLANSPMYSVFGHGVNTVSKAVIVLGTDAIGHLALGLKLADGLSAASADSINARNEMEKALLASHIARQIASCAGVRDVEEVVVCSMLHSLGRMMVAFYLSERWALVQTRCADGGLDEHTVAREILGIGMDEIGRLVAQDWGLPALLVDSLKDVSPKSIDESLSHDDWLAAVSTMSSRCAVLLHENQVSATQKIAKLADGYAGMLGLDASQLLVVVESARKTAEEEAVFVRPGRLAAEAGNGTTPFSGKPANAAQLLISGVADVRDASGSLGAAQLLTMALETVYKSLGF
ncbi:MAG TPA: HDOD domain-containing protein, partial [Burkholderiaceae bacterium]|nr:HDOD domain-containing protein [Burkholderiaceae bacterium]